MTGITSLLGVGELLLPFRYQASLSTFAQTCGGEDIKAKLTSAEVLA